MSNASGGWRSYRPSRGKHKPGVAPDRKEAPSNGAAREVNDADPVPKKLPARPINAWASGPPASQILKTANGAAFNGVGGGGRDGSGRAPSARGGQRGGSRGRGRGSMRGGARVAPNAPPPPNADDKFRDVTERHKAAIQRQLEIYVSSSEESDDEDGEGDAKLDGGKAQRILDAVLENFSLASSSSSSHDPTRPPPPQSDNMKRTYQLLTSCLEGGSLVCLVCIGTVKKNDPVWSCEDSCFALFHLPCIQKWVNEGAYRAASTLSDEAFPRRDLPWQCPKCRFDYPRSSCPTRYRCFCGKTEDPPFSPWNLPHSCGEVCEKKLNPECGHRCLLLCHPGPCPPCPQTVTNSCYCRKSLPKLVRCGNRVWSCGKLCDGPLSCGRHSCKLPCHPGDCQPCNKKSTRRCRCGRSEATTPCADPPFDCGQVCGAPFPCGHHVCERVCHEGACGQCPLTDRRTCPCGKKSVSNVPCTQEIPGCGDTCGKLLACRKHRCHERCHAGPCVTCRDVAERKCRCGRHRRKIQCSDESEFHCQDKCQKLKDCERHACKRKCCDGNCPPCENPCGRTLGCGKHKCVSRCHVGRCYPCGVTKDLKCFCGFTVVTFPCGDRTAPTKPPRCVKPCRIPSACHHPRRKPHRCHFGECPPCAFVCHEPLQGCDHFCDSVCHDNVVVETVDRVKRAGPWEKAPETKREIVKAPCPPCPVPVPIECVGGHVERDVPCAEVAPWSCGVECGRHLSCGNHRCALPCHEVEANDETLASDFAGDNCLPCEKPCSFPRPSGCNHKCPKGACHPAGECPPCKKMVKFRCHCDNVVKHLPCLEVNGVEPDVFEAAKSCGGNCPKSLDCGHPCGLACHSGPCSAGPDPAALCKAKVAVKCACKRIKRDFPCPEARRGAAVPCDAKCAAALEAKRLREEEERRKKEEEEEERRKKVAEEFERRQRGPKRTRKNRSRGESESMGVPWRARLPSVKKCFVVSAIVVGVGAVVGAAILGLTMED